MKLVNYSRILIKRINFSVTTTRASVYLHKSLSKRGFNLDKFPSLKYFVINSKAVLELLILTELEKTISEDYVNLKN